MARHHYLLSITVRDRSHSDLRVSDPSTSSHDYYVKSNRIEVMAHQPAIALMLCLNDALPGVSAGMIGVVGARHAVPLRLPRQQQHNSASLVAQQVTL
ncbi:MAG: hypothetical protein KatS3mg054_1305 [Chloroflexus sp.]|nr:MAG: hypothetical protein KatS3mg054_1305 [Chloroflexus sp.]